MISLTDNTRKTASFMPDVADGMAGEGTQLLRKVPVYQDRWWSTHDGLRLYARDYPAASGRVRLPVICLHGLTRNSADFEEVAPYIAKLDRRVIVPDLRGRGLSAHDPDPTNYHLWTYARDILDLCDAMGIGQAIFIGNSMGGLLTMALSTLRPTLIRSAILNDIGPVLAPKGMARIAGNARQAHIAFKTWHDAGVFVAERYRVAYPNYTPQDWQKFAKRVFMKGRDHMLHLACDPRITEAFAGGAVTGDDMGPCYLSLATGRRILLVHGALSDLLTDKEAKAMGNVSSDFTRVDVDYVGHAPSLMEPQARAAVHDFLESQG